MLFGTDLKVGHKVMYEGDPYEITSSEHLKVAMGKGLSKVVMKNLVTGRVLSGKTFREVDKFEEADVSKSSYDYLYNDGTQYYFMNRDTYEQVILNKATLSGKELFLNDGDRVMLQEFNGVPIDLNLEPSVTLEVIETPPGEKGDTATGGKKPATLSTGLVIQVPLFINIGDKIKVDTKNSQYQSRA